MKTKIQDWEEEFREYFDKTLKPKKPTIKNLDREVCINFIGQVSRANLIEIFREIKNYDFKEKHLCRFNDGKQDCDCFIAGLNVALEILNNYK